MVRRAVATDKSEPTDGCNGPNPEVARVQLALSGQLGKQRLRLFQIERVEAFGEPAVNRSEQFARLLQFALITLEPRHAHRGA